ncbi:Ribosomal protein L18a [Giardia muris]|uniref:60S ribosomal protein L18a n=1 Tax=Giardia muris TaxID=5742 RepID=A0A4Z1SU67_GIAMU|nr:Ribosomal protein L18a [Giardia muris]|eukprot:TNJ29452.1 Ribosomal protein L18a [Giardia muris]
MMQKYVVYGRKLPSEQEPAPEVYKMVIYAPNEIVAKGRFWYHLKSLKKIKKTRGEVLDCQLVEEPCDQVKNFGILLRYRSRTGQHNMYREVRETTSARAMHLVYSQMAGQHRVRYNDIQVIKVSEVADADVRREKVAVFTRPGVKFPHPRPYVQHLRAARDMRFQYELPKIE